MKKLMASLMIVLFSVNTFASTVSEVSALKPAFDNLQYKLQVEWDQKDPAFKQEALKAFEAQIEELTAQGLKGEEIISFVKENVLDAQAAADLEQIMSLVESQNMSVEEAKNVVKNYVDKLYADGASYRGRNGGALYTILGAAVLAVVLVAILTADYVYVYDDPYYYDTCYWGWGYDWYGNYVYDCWYY